MEERVPLVIPGGSEYGTRPSRDWAAKGPLSLGVTVVIAKSFERIHRSNLVGMGVLPLMFEDGEDADVLALTGAHTFDIEEFEKGAKQVKVLARDAKGSGIRFTAKVRIDTPMEEEYFSHGGILQYVIRQLAA